MLRMRKKAGEQLEFFDGGVAALFDYYRARRMLASCLLLSPLAGALCAASAFPFLELAVLLLALNKHGLHRMTELAVYATGGGLAARSERAQDILWEDVKHLLAGMALVLLVTTAALLWRRHAGAPAEEIRLREAMQLCYVFLFVSLFSVQISHVDLVTRPLKKTAALTGVFYGACLLLLFHYKVGAAARLAMTLIPCLLLPLLCLCQLAAARRRQGCFMLAYAACLNACAWPIFSYFFIWNMPYASRHLGYAELWVQQEPSWAMWLGAWLLLAYAAGANLALAFMRAEKIRRGQFAVDPRDFLKGARCWRFREERRRVAQMCKPALRSAKSWDGIHRLTRLASKAPAAAVFSTLATLGFLLLGN